MDTGSAGGNDSSAFLLGVLSSLVRMAAEARTAAERDEFLGTALALADVAVPR